MTRIEQMASVAEKGGAAVAVSSGALGWLSQNYYAILAICGIVGATVAVLGFCVQWYYLHKRRNGR